MFSETWLTVFLVERAVSKAAGNKVGQGRGNGPAYLMVSIVDVGGYSTEMVYRG